MLCVDPSGAHSHRIPWARHVWWTLHRAVSTWDCCSSRRPLPVRGVDTCAMARARQARSLRWVWRPCAQHSSGDSACCCGRWCWHAWPRSGNPCRAAMGCTRPRNRQWTRLCCSAHGHGHGTLRLQVQDGDLTAAECDLIDTLLLRALRAQDSDVSMLRPLINHIHHRHAMAQLHRGLCSALGVIADGQPWLDGGRVEGTLPSGTGVGVQWLATHRMDVACARCGWWVACIATWGDTP